MVFDNQNQNQASLEIEANCGFALVSSRLNKTLIVTIIFIMKLWIISCHDTISRKLVTVNVTKVRVGKLLGSHVKMEVYLFEECIIPAKWSKHNQLHILKFWSKSMESCFFRSYLLKAETSC